MPWRPNGKRAFEEGDRAFLAFVAQHFTVGQAQGIIETDVQVFPAGAELSAAGITGDA